LRKNGNMVLRDRRPSVKMRNLGRGGFGGRIRWDRGGVFCGVYGEERTNTGKSGGTKGGRTGEEG